MGSYWMILAFMFTALLWHMVPLSAQHKKGGALPNRDFLPAKDSGLVMAAFSLDQGSPGFLNAIGAEKDALDTSIMNTASTKELSSRARVFFINDQRSRILWGAPRQGYGAQALLRFTVEGLGSANRADYFYILYQKKGTHWQRSSLPMPAVWDEDLYFEADSIRGTMIYGYLLPKQADGFFKPVKAVFRIKNGELVNESMGFHKRSDPVHYLDVKCVILPLGSTLPLKGSRADLEERLGKKGIIQVGQADCGTYFEASPTRYMAFLPLKFELSPENQAALIEIKLDAGYALNTSLGMMDQNVCFEALSRCFDKEALIIKEQMMNGAKRKVLSVPTGKNADTRWEFYWDQAGRLAFVRLFIPC